MIVSGVEEFVDGEDVFAAVACSAGAQSTHEGAAVFASLGAEHPGFAFGAFVDGAGPAGPLGW